MITSWFFSWFIKTKLWFWFSRKILPFLRFHIWGSSTYDMEKVYEIVEILKANPDKIYGFVSLDDTTFSFKLNHWLTKAKWSHSGLINLDKQGRPRVLHIVGSGLENWSLLREMKDINDFALLEIPIKIENREKAYQRIHRIVSAKANIEYDFDFTLSEEYIKAIDSNWPLGKMSMYCSEFIYLIGHGLLEENSVFLSHKVLSKKTFEPDDVWDSCIKVFH
jgi:hypothetical protein